jgi:hypothetical protein
MMKHRDQLIKAAMKGVGHFLESDEGQKHFPNAQVAHSDDGGGFVVFSAGHKATTYVHFLTVELGEVK